MNKYNNLSKILIAAMAFFIVPSCKKTFLDETLKTSQGNEFFKTDAGILQLAAGGYYQVFTGPTNGEWWYCQTQYGTDEFKVGGDPSNSPWNNYDATLAPGLATSGNLQGADVMWDALYIGIGDANLLIQNASASTSTSAAIKSTALGEGYFFRAYNYLRLVQQWGAVPLKTTPSTTVELEFTRAEPKDIYAQIIADFTQARNLLPASGGPSRLTKDAAAHFLAKAYLARASEINSSWNSATVAADLAAVVTLCDGVIANHPLATNFASLWNFTGINSANEILPEVILSAQMTNDVTTNNAVGNTQHLYFISRYDIQDQLARDLGGGRPFSRMATTYYDYRIYDRVNDSRFWKSFRTKWTLNGASPVAPNVKGDMGMMFVINQPGDPRNWIKSKICKGTVNNDTTQLIKDPLTNHRIPTVYVAYPVGTTLDTALNKDLTTAYQAFPPLSKHFDGSRNALNDVVGHRDFILARSAETYLIAAEAKIRLAKLGTGAYTDALPYINAVRTRAQYANGESRSSYYDGGNTILSASLQTPGVINSFYPANSYYESNNIPVTTAASAPLAVTNIAALPAQDEYIISVLNLTSSYDRMLCLVLNERSRELCGEYLRWEDLARTKTLVPRTKAFNIDAATNVADKHLLRPIPQTFLNDIRKGGAPLTPAEKQAMQNPGY
ncbi:MAG: RagB/SusD family nutrient uptake outer membrane protein [Ferruginibacter sp.]